MACFLFFFFFFFEKFGAFRIGPSLTFSLSLSLSLSLFFSFSPSLIFSSFRKQQQNTHKGNDRASSKLAERQEPDEPPPGGAESSGPERRVRPRHARGEHLEPAHQQVRAGVEQREGPGQGRDPGPPGQAHRVGHREHADAHEDLDDVDRRLHRRRPPGLGGPPPAPALLELGARGHGLAGARGRRGALYPDEAGEALPALVGGHRVEGRERLGSGRGGRVGRGGGGGGAAVERAAVAAAAAAVADFARDARGAVDAGRGALERIVVFVAVAVAVTAVAAPALFVWEGGRGESKEGKRRKRKKEMKAGSAKKKKSLGLRDSEGVAGSRVVDVIVMCSFFLQGNQTRRED